MIIIIMRQQKIKTRQKCTYFAYVRPRVIIILHKHFSSVYFVH